ncbi:Oidioi.mRNA.OKI2018_I69.chr1.g3738.t1.cds [Oikopleura dioica]|uniref:Oidioi.mRNA.OKI2018_I69.chr1.g3738.t1.cds n=1 Tax=Oikopleura dioica TaxID=34765 RepID=A0ABN7SZD0_OIKDI|nr:Oidioi.mRNA.OKI2018_I69.chr1.g3738.t1.cds [Oikopleura dioica]
MHVILDKFVSSYGELGQCSECESACESTCLIRGKRFCKECKDEKYPKKVVEFQDSDATFKCRAESCGADKLSYREVLVGSCCEAAIRKTPSSLWEARNERNLMSNMYMKIKKERYSSNSKFYEAQDAFYSAVGKVRAAEEALKKAKENVKTAEKKVQLARNNQKFLRQLEDKSEKRVLIITKAAFRDHDEPLAKKVKLNESGNENNECRVCLRPYNDDRPEAIIIPCAHKFCFYCISSLLQKKCPNCRAEFTDNNVYKTH